MKDKTFYIPIGIAAFFLIGGMALGGALASGSTWLFFKSPPQLAVVDMQALIAKGSQHLAKGKTSKVSSHQIQETGEQLKGRLETFAAKHRLILLAKGAVMGGDIPDYTNEIMKDAFPDYTATLMAFLQNKAASQQSRSQRPESQEDQP